MYPIIFEYNGLVISSYGLMLMLAFVTCNYLLKNYLIQINKDPKVGDDIIFYAAIGGIIGAKLYYILEGIPTGEAQHNIDGFILIFKGLFTLSFQTLAQGINQFGSGLVFLGGLIGGMLSVTIYIRKNNLDWLTVGDWVAPYLALGHAIGRIGCFLVGDCYGKPCELPWAVSFPKGLPATTYENFQLFYPDVFIEYVQNNFNPGDIISVHPTQIYESLIYFSVFIFLLKIRNNKSYNGFVIYQYLLLAGISRFMIEIFRLNPKYILGFSGAQCISLIMIIISLLLLYKNKSFLLKQK